MIKIQDLKPRYGVKRIDRNLLRKISEKIVDLETDSRTLFLSFFLPMLPLLLLAISLVAIEAVVDMCVEDAVTSACGD